MKAIPKLLGEIQAELSQVLASGLLFAKDNSRLQRAAKSCREWEGRAAVFGKLAEQLEELVGDSAPASSLVRAGALVRAISAAQQSKLEGELEPLEMGRRLLGNKNEESFEFQELVSAFDEPGKFREFIKPAMEAGQLEDIRLVQRAVRLISTWPDAMGSKVLARKLGVLFGPQMFEIAEAEFLKGGDAELRFMEAMMEIDPVRAKPLLLERAAPTTQVEFLDHMTDAEQSDLIRERILAEGQIEFRQINTQVYPQDTEYTRALNRLRPLMGWQNSAYADLLMEYWQAAQGQSGTTGRHLVKCVVEHMVGQGSPELVQKLIDDVSIVPAHCYPQFLDASLQHMLREDFDRLFSLILARKKQMQNKREKAHAVAQWMSLQPVDWEWKPAWRTAALSSEEPLAVAVCAEPGSEEADRILKTALALGKAEDRELPLLIRGLFRCESIYSVSAWFDIAETMGRNPAGQAAEDMMDLLPLLPDTCIRGVNRLLSQVELDPTFLDLLEEKAALRWGPGALED